MAVGGETDPDRLRRAQFEACAREVDVKPRWLIDVVHATAESILNAFDEAARASGTTRSPAAARIAPIVRKQARRLLREFEG